MNNNIDDWLNSLGFDNPQSSSQTHQPPANFPQPSTINPQPSLPNVPSAVLPTQPDTPQPLTPSDFNDILQDIGFQEAEEAVVVDDVDFEEEAEEETEEHEAVEELEPEDNNTDSMESPQESPTPLNTNTDVAQHSTINPQQNNPQPNTLIPPNSPTILLDDTTSRFSGTEWYNKIQEQQIILAGCGGIGSWTALQLARLHPARLTLYDDDVVEAGNMSGQLYNFSSNGSSKTSALTDILRNFTSMTHINSIRDRYTEQTRVYTPIMICGFDNMEARKVFFNSWLRNVNRAEDQERKNYLFLDGRLSINVLQVFAITGDDTASQERYQNDWLFSDSEADETVCSLKQTSYLAGMIGSIITNIFVNFVANTLDPILPYDVPFFTEYDAQNMIFKTEQ